MSPYGRLKQEDARTMLGMLGLAAIVSTWHKDSRNENPVAVPSASPSAPAAHAQLRSADILSFIR